MQPVRRIEPGFSIRILRHQNQSVGNELCWMSCCRPAARWMFASNVAQRHDQAHLLSHHIQMPLASLATLLTQVLPYSMKLYVGTDCARKGTLLFLSLQS